MADDYIDFVTLGKIKGNGNSSSYKNYYFSDKRKRSEEKKVIYYRLKQVDYNGQSHYSNIISTSNCSDNALPVIYPNPTNGQVIIHNTNNGHDAATVTISNAMGQIVMNNTIADFAGTHRFDLSSFSNGIYTVAVNAGNSNMTYRLVLNK